MRGNPSHQEVRISASLRRKATRSLGSNEPQFLSQGGNYVRPAESNWGLKYEIADIATTMANASSLTGARSTKERDESRRAINRAALLLRHASRT